MQSQKGNLRLKLLENMIWCVRNLAITSTKGNNTIPMKQLTLEEKIKILYIIRSFIDTQE